MYLFGELFLFFVLLLFVLAMSTVCHERKTQKNNNKSNKKQTNKTITRNIKQRTSLYFNFSLEKNPQNNNNKKTP